MLFNDGAGTLAPEVRYAVGVGASALAIVDSPGDGTGDLAVAGPIDQLVVLSNDGAGAFFGPVTFDLGPGPADIVAGRLNNDGRLDLAVALEDAQALVTLRSVCSCLGDVIDNGVVNLHDLIFVVSLWGREGTSADLDRSGVVDFGDIVLVLRAWGPCP